MRWIRYEKNGHPTYGIVEGDTVTEVKGDPVRRVRENDHSSADGVGKAADPGRAPHLLLRRPQLRRTRDRGGDESAARNPNLPKAADIGYRANNALIAHGEAIVIPPDATERVQYEGELVAVIGRKAKRLSEAEALGCVLGWTIGNDMSERTWQATTALCGAPRTPTPSSRWVRGSRPISISTRPQTIIRVNGDEKIRFKTDHMLFGPATFISRMSQYLTLYPGDVVWMGTDGAPENVKHGDTIDVEITGIGTLSNPVVRAGR